jgi:FMN phosphatase YigB (HAD superfamily)
MLDLGDTLVHDGAVFPHVVEALESFREMRTAEGKPLEICLVSDFTMPAPPVTPKKIGEIFDEYLGLLEQFGLRPFFEPVERRVTLSTHAGANKPDRAVFDKALQRLKENAALTECLFITENEAHIKACRTLGMETLRFGSAEGFTDWAQAPSLVAAKLRERPS